MRQTFFLLLFYTSISISAQTIIEKYPNGQIMSEITYKDSVKNGFAKYYFEDGKPDAVIEFKNGELVGTIKEFYETGYKYREIDVKTLKAKVYTRDSLSYYKGTYDNNKFIRNGIWEDWSIKYNFKRFAWTFVNDYKTGPYTAFRKNGSIEATGHYINGTLTDTLKLFNEKGVLQEMQVWKENAKGTGSDLLNTIYLTDKKSDGTPEVIDGKIYIWKNGKKEFLSNVGE